MSDDRHTGECDACDHEFVSATFEDVVDHTFDEHARHMGDFGDLESVVAFDFALSHDQIEYLHNRMSDGGSASVE